MVLVTNPSNYASIVAVQSYGKGYLPGYDLKEGRSDYAVKAEDRGHDGAAAAQKYAHQPPTRRT